MPQILLALHYAQCCLCCIIFSLIVVCFFVHSRNWCLVGFGVFDVICLQRKRMNLGYIIYYLVAGCWRVFFLRKSNFSTVCMDYHSLVDLQFDPSNALKPFQKAPFVKIRWTLFWLVYENMWLSQKVCVFLYRLNKHIKQEQYWYWWLLNCLELDFCVEVPTHKHEFWCVSRLSGLMEIIAPSG